MCRGPRQWPLSSSHVLSHTSVPKSHPWYTNIRRSSRPVDAPGPPSATQARKKVTIPALRHLYKRNEPITMMTAYDYPSGLAVELAAIDTCLVGDSLAMVALGYASTNEVSLDEMLHHCRAVSRAVKSTFLIGDMPFGSYEVSPMQATQNAIRFLRQGRVEAVKLEGGIEMAPTIASITRVGIPVLGHIGLTPQRTASLGGYRVQGKTLAKAKELLSDAKALQDAGCFALESALARELLDRF
ncbi:3-methyl-2-oxobutanoate hydroxymethyltransferase [Synchytrium endobioticum]|nr:3-methyl-2-oxobutanoate hydroxymethyltransferase [Synchytrium endobioticum]